MAENDTTIILGGGNVEYSLEAAVTSIEELLAALTEALDDGATHVVMSSGNYRGAKWATIHPDYCWASDE